MIRVRRSNRLSGIALFAVIAGSTALLAPAAVPASTGSGDSRRGTETQSAAGLRSGPAHAATTGTGGPAVAERTLESLAGALEALAATEPKPDPDMMRQAFVRAGFAADSVEVSVGATPTGLAVDSMTGAAADGGVCSFGEVRNGQVSVSHLPVLDSGYCFVGDQR